MNVIWIVSDTLRRDHLGAYGNTTIETLRLDALAATSVRFDRHYAAAFPTMCSRADQHRELLRFMRETSVAQRLIETRAGLQL